MTGAGSTPRTQKELIRNTERRLRGQERRLVPQSLREGGRLGATILSHVGDLNDLIYTGWYQSAGPTGSANRPPEADALGLGSLEIQVVALASGSVFQTARTHGPVGEPYRWEWVRDYRGERGWFPWRLVSAPQQDFVPSVVQGFSLGNGSAIGQYGISDGQASGRMIITLGSTSIMYSADLILAYPVPIAVGMTNRFSGGGRLRDTSASNYYDAFTLMATGGVYVRTTVVAQASSGNAYPRQIAVSPNAPFTWASGDQIEIYFEYPTV